MYSVCVKSYNFCPSPIDLNNLRSTTPLRQKDSTALISVVLQYSTDEYSNSDDTEVKFSKKLLKMKHIR